MKEAEPCFQDPSVVRSSHLLWPGCIIRDSPESWLLAFELFLSAAWLCCELMESIHQMETFWKRWEGGRPWRTLLALSFGGDG